MKLEPNTTRAGIAAVLSDSASSRGKYHVVEVGGGKRWFAPVFSCQAREHKPHLAAPGGRGGSSSALYHLRVVRLVRAPLHSFPALFLPISSSMSRALTLVDRRNAQVWWIQSVFVAPAHRRKGHYRCTSSSTQQPHQRHTTASVKLPSGSACHPSCTDRQSLCSSFICYYVGLQV